MKAVLFAVLILATAPVSGTAQRVSEGSCTRFDCTAASGVKEMVNRNAKGDRLPAAPGLHQLPAKQAVKIETFLRDRKLAEGCESLASSLSASSLANIAGRCLS